MKRVTLSLIVLLVLMLVCITVASGDQTNDAAKQGAQVSSNQATTASPQTGEIQPTVKSKGVMTQTEAESLCAQGDSLLAESGVNAVPVGSLDSSELIYILVVVLLVVVIVSVVR